MQSGVSVSTKSVHKLRLLMHYRSQPLVHTPESHGTHSHALHRSCGRENWIADINMNCHLFWGPGNTRLDDRLPLLGLSHCSDPRRTSLRPSCNARFCLSILGRLSIFDGQENLVANRFNSNFRETWMQVSLYLENLT